jgi:NADPH:quinone reductase-like Zn-dependent oxidoreductase
MKAIVYHEYGTPDVLALEDVDQPTPGDDEVLVRVRAASVNSWDWDLLTGTPLYSRLEGLRKPKYEILGADIAGRVEAVGTNVERLRPGDDVFGDISGCGWGGYAEYVAVPEHALAMKSPAMTFEESAAIPQAGGLALQGVHNKGNLQRGESILINGAGGGVGTFAIQMAKRIGAEVTAVDSTEKLDLMRDLGADNVIDYRRSDYTKNGRRYDMILDVVARRSIFRYRGSLGPHGRFVMIGGSVSTGLQTMLIGPLLSQMGSMKLGLLIHRPNTEDLARMNELYEAGEVVPIIERVYPLSETPAALRHVGEGHALGKVVITV